MTAVLAIDFFYKIIVIANCRVSWKGGSYKPQDNLQKIYPFGPTGVLAFSGDLRPAKIVLKKFVRKPQNYSCLRQQKCGFH